MARTAPRRKTITADDGTRQIVDRNANGEGSVFWDASKDRWRATYWHDGRRRSVLAATRTAAERRRDEKVQALADAAPAGVLGADPTVAQLVDWFLDRVADVRPNTLYSYRAQCRPITADIGELRIGALTVEHLRIFLGDLRTEHTQPDGTTRPAYSDHTASNIRARLRQILEEAVTLGYIDTNPVLRIKAPRTGGTSKKVKATLTADQCKALVRAAAGHPMGAAVAMLFTMGNRSSEVLGLAWSDIEMWDETITDEDTGETKIVPMGTAVVQRGSTFSGKGIGQRLGPTKTAGTAGVHQLPPSVVAMLRVHQRAQAIERERAGMMWKGPTYQGVELDLVWCNETGGLVYSHRLYNAVRECCALADIPHEGVGTHTGRRSVITALHVAGLSIEDIMHLVGHSQMATTSGYVQHLGERPAATAQARSDLLDPGGD